MVMNAAALSIGLRTGGNVARLAQPFDLSSIPPALIKREPAPRRTKIWEFNTNLHCSIIGTCLSVQELRQILRKLGVVVQDRTDHDLHGIGVSMAGRHDDAARQLNKALDQRHKTLVHQFAKADDEDKVLTLCATLCGKATSRAPTGRC